MTIALPDVTTVPGIRKNGEYCNGMCEDCDCREKDDPDIEIEEL
jgi:hypothetical protein